MRNSFGPLQSASGSANPTPFHKSARLRPPTSKPKSKQHQKLEGLIGNAGGGGGLSSLPNPILGVGMSRQHSALTPRSASLVPSVGGASSMMTTSNASGTSSLSCSNYSLRSLLRISDYAVLSQHRLHVNTIDRPRTTDDAPATAKSSRRGSFSSSAADAPPERKSSFDSLVEHRRSLFRALHDPTQRRSISADDDSETPSTAVAQSPAHEIPSAASSVPEPVSSDNTNNSDSQTDGPVSRVSLPTGNAASAGTGPSTVRPLARSKGRSSEPRLPSWKFRPIGVDHSISIDEENSTDALNDAGSPSLFTSSQQLRRDTTETQATAGDAATPLLGNKREDDATSSPRHSPKEDRARSDPSNNKSSNSRRSRQNSNGGGGLLARLAAFFCVGRWRRPFHHRSSSRSHNSPSGQLLSPRERGETTASTRLE